MKRNHIITVALTGPFAAASLVACGGDREASAETGVAEAEVSTELPETVISDERLQATAEGAAAVASTPPAQVVMVPGAPAAGTTAGTTTGTTTGTTGSASDGMTGSTAGAAGETSR